MNDTKELIDVGTMGMALAVLSGAGLLLAPFCLWMANEKASDGWRKIGLVALCLVLTWPLWLVYNRIEDHFGLDSVAALLLNLALFAVLGVALGFILRRVWPRDFSTAEIAENAEVSQRNAV
jgi:hypothetical protein